MNISKCKWCEKEFDLTEKTKGWMANHSRWCDKNPNKIKYKSSLEKARDKINYEKVSKSLKQAWKNGKYSNVNFNKPRNPLLKEHCENISKKLKLAHAEGRHPGWSHINADKSRRSYPESKFLKILISSGLMNRYNIIEKMPYGKYFLDFVIIDLKLNIEIDGQQHWRNKENIEHDNIRNEYLIENGWKVYRIPAVNIINEPDKVLSNLLNFINNGENIKLYELADIKFKLKKQKKFGNRQKYSEKIKKINDELNKPKVQKVLDSDIDFTKYGWVKSVADIIEIKPQKVKQWMERNMSNFYDEICYKRC